MHKRKTIVYKKKNKVRKKKENRNIKNNMVVPDTFTIVMQNISFY